MNPNKVHNAIQAISKIILGKEQQIRLAISCLIANGHLLIEDQPGVGKTTLAHAIANTLGLNLSRIQFTNDLLPGDVLGVSIYAQDKQTFQFHRGPIFSNFILADEINRASPKTQSALLEAMEEKQVTIDSNTHELPLPFFVIATQNPGNQIGTYPLPESQLDRFLMKIDLGYPNQEAEKEILLGTDKRQRLIQQPSIMSKDEIIELQMQVNNIHVSEPVLEYIQAIIGFSRDSNLFENGLSPRAGIGIVNTARAVALIDNHEYVLPEHVKEILPSVINHRLQFINQEIGLKSGKELDHAASHIIKNIKIP